MPCGLLFYVCWVINRGYSNFLLNMAFISPSELENIYISRVAKPRMKYTYCSLHE